MSTKQWEVAQALKTGMLEEVGNAIRAAAGYFYDRVLDYANRIGTKQAR